LAPQDRDRALPNAPAKRQDGATRGALHSARDLLQALYRDETPMTNEPRATIRRREGRLTAKTIADLTAALASRFGDRLVTSHAVRMQHGHTLTWLENAPPDAVVFAGSR
jgi:hypothetical protein